MFKRLQIFVEEGLTIACILALIGYVWYMVLKC
jgi:hypothetical protein